MTTTTILMHGPAFDGSGTLVERLIPETDVKAFIDAGYVSGGLPEVPALVEAAPDIPESKPSPKGKRKQ
jgi:hypothetical protein